MKRQILLTCVALLLCLGLSAQTAVAPASGSGTAGSPYQIASLGNLYWIAVDATRWNKHYIQTVDIDASATQTWFPIVGGGYYGWLPIGNASTKFTGTFNGNNFSIQALYINRGTTANVGFFGYTSNATISSVNIDNADITGEISVGALIGYSYNSRTSLCTSSGEVTGITSSQTQVGGLIGTNFTSSAVDECSSSCTVSGNENTGGLIGLVYSSTVDNSFSTGSVSGYQNIGGLAGKTSASSTISVCYSTAEVSGSNINIGGLVGWNTGVSIIEDCYSSGTVIGSGSADSNGIVGGLVGENYSTSSSAPSIIRNSYSNSSVSGSFRVGGLVGRNNNSTVENCYSTGNATGRTYTGGFMGSNIGSSAVVRTSYSTGNATSSTAHCGGFVGWNGNSATLENTYCRGNVKRSSAGTAAQYGGYVGYNEGTISYSYSTGKVEWSTSAPTTKGFCGSIGTNSIMSTCYWDTEASLQSTSTGDAVGKTTAQMLNTATYASWDFTTVWAKTVNINNGYPYLQSNPGDITLPVELSSFLAYITHENFVRIDWITQSETGVAGYYIYRGDSSDLANSKLVSPLILAGNSSAESRYSFVDNDIFAYGTYYYWLQSMDLDGSFSFHGPLALVFQTQEDPSPETPLITGINSTYPNPFNPTLFISYSVKNISNIDISVFNLKGQRVNSWSFPSHNAGNFKLRWDATDLQSGTYFLRFTAGSAMQTHKITLMK